MKILLKAFTLIPSSESTISLQCVSELLYIQEFEGAHLPYFVLVQYLTVDIGGGGTKTSMEREERLPISQ